MKKIYTSLIMATVLFVLWLIPANAFAQNQNLTYLPSGAIQLKQTWIQSGVYYVVAEANGIITCSEDEPPSGGYLYYDASTGVLKLHDFTLTVSESSSTHQLLSIVNSKVTEGTNYSLTIELSGTNSLTLVKEDEVTNDTAVDLKNVDCTITGTGSLTVDCATPNGNTQGKYTAACFNSLYVNSPVSLNFSASCDGEPVLQDANPGTLHANNEIKLTDGTLTVTGPRSIYSGNTINISGNADVKISDCFDKYAITGAKGVAVEGGKITIEGSEENYAKMVACGIDAPYGTVNITGGTITITNAKMAIRGKSGVNITGGIVNAVSKSRQAITSDGNVTISGNADVTAKGGIDPENGSAIQGANVYISGGKVTAIGGTGTGCHGIYGKDSVSISGGIVNAESTTGSALYSDGNVNITGGTVAVKEDTAFNGNLTIDGNTVFYCNGISANSTLTKGIVYTGTTVSLGDDGTLSLTGGNGTIYGNPDIASDAYVKPSDSILKTALDDCVTITAQDIVYTGNKCIPVPRVMINKKALGGQLELTEGTDYVLAETDNEDYVNVGSPKMKIVAVNSSGYTGSKDFTFRITPKAGLTWDTSGLTVSKYEDGTTSPAAVMGSLKVNGAEGAELIYDDITASAYPDSAAGRYTVVLTLKNPRLSNDNYVLPAEDVTVTAEIHHLLKHVEAQDATSEKEGNIEYWLCEGCSKYFADSDGQSVLSHADVIIEKLEESETGSETGSETESETGSETPEVPEAPGSDLTQPDTGDDSQIILWMAVLALSITVLTTVCFKKRKASVK